jgi:uncharacterized membrane protein YbhN (UPF0104 family)
MMCPPGSEIRTYRPPPTPGFIGGFETGLAALLNHRVIGSAALLNHRVIGLAALLDHRE